MVADAAFWVFGGPVSSFFPHLEHRVSIQAHAISLAFPPYQIYLPKDKKI